jgi:hypothetical protein
VTDAMMEIFGVEENYLADCFFLCFIIPIMPPKTKVKKQIIKVENTIGWVK